MKISIRSMARQFEEVYESWLSNLAAGALATVTLAGAPMKASAAAPASNPPTLENVAQHVNMAVPKERPRSFKEFRDRYMFSIYHTQVPGLPMLSSSAETFAGPRFNAILSSYVRQHETKGKYTPQGTKGNYVVRNGVNYAQRLPDPSGGYTIGDGISLNKDSPFPSLVAPYLHNGVAFTKDWKPILTTSGIRDKVYYLEANTADAVATAFFNNSRAALIRFLSKKGVNYNNLDSYAKLALEDLAFNQGGNISYKRMLEALAKPTPDYVRAAYEMCDCKDWETFGGLRQRRIHGAHLLLMAAERNGGMDIYKNMMGGPQLQAQQGEQHPIEEKPGVFHYAVSKGDSLWSIAKNFHSTIDEIAADNDLNATAVLPVGKVLRVRSVRSENMDNSQKEAMVAANVPRTTPTTKWHTVAPGETFSGIAFKNKVKLATMKKLNPTMDYNRIRPGQKVRVS